MAAPSSNGTSLAGRNCKLKQTLGSSAQNAIIAPLVLMRCNLQSSSVTPEFCRETPRNFLRRARLGVMYL